MDVKPPDDSIGGFDLDEAWSALDHLELLSVGDLADAVGDSGDAVAQDGLLGGDVDVLGLRVRAEAAAAGGGQQGAEHCAGEEPASAQRISAENRGQRRIRRHVLRSSSAG